MRIGIDARLINQTGVGRYIRNLIANLKEIDKKNDYTLFIRSEDLKEFKIQNSKFKIVKVDVKWHSLAEQIMFKHILDKENLDLVHFPYFSIPIFYNKPFVVTIHDLILHHIPTGKASMLPYPVYLAKLAFYKFVISKAAKKAKKVIAVSNSTKNEIVDHLKINPEKVEVIYEGVDRQIANSKWQIDKSHTLYAISNKPFFLYVGNVYPHKNTETLIEAFRKINQSDLCLIFAGKEDYFHKRLRQKVKSNKNIFFLENVSDSELSWIYQNAVATVCPAFMEGFGLPALEAMANKCLVIASDIPSLREVCQDNAIYFNPKDSQELSQEMDEILNNKNKYKELVEGGFKRSQEFSWEKMTKETLKIYNQAVF